MLLHSVADGMAMTLEKQNLEVKYVFPVESKGNLGFLIVDQCKCA